MYSFQRWFISILFLFSLKASAIVNTESLLQSFDQPGINGEISAEFKGSSGNNSTSQLAIDAAIGWNSGVNKSILIFGREFGKARQVTNIDSSFIYIKHLHHVNGRFYASFFAQNEQDTFRDIQNRQVFGIGSRAQLHKSHLIELSLMAEKIESTLANEANRENFRLNLMWYFSHRFDNKIKVKNTLYYQPSFDDISDVQAINQLGIEFVLLERVNMTLYHKLTHFSEPIGNASSTDTSYGTQFSYHF